MKESTGLCKTDRKFKLILAFFSIALMIGIIRSQSLSIKADSPLDITKDVNVTLHNFYVTRVEKNAEKKYHIIEKGVKADPLPAVHQNDGVHFDFKWNITAENMGKVKKGSYFDIKLPPADILKRAAATFNVSMPVNDEIKKIGTMEIDGTGNLRVTLDYDFTGIHELKNGILGLDASLEKKAMTDGLNLDFETGTTIKIDVLPPYIENTEFDIGVHVPSTHKDLLNKGGYYAKKLNKIEYVFVMNLDEMKKMYETDSLTPKRNVYVVDELPEGLEIDTKNIFANFPLFPPAIDPATKQITNKMSSTVGMTPYFAINKTQDAMLSNGRKVFDVEIVSFDGSDAEKTANWETFKTKILNSGAPTVGVWNKKKIIVYFGTLPFNHTYKELVGGLEGIIDDSTVGNAKRNKPRVNVEQATKMKEVYPNMKVASIYFKFYANVLGNQTKFQNNASAFWDNGNTMNDAHSVEVKGGGSIEFEPFKGEVIVEKKWNGATEAEKKPVTVTLVKNGTKTDMKKTLDASNSWTDKFTGLGEYEGGKKIEYTVTEEAMDGFRSKSIQETGKYKFIITNTKLTDFKVTKKWTDSNGNVISDPGVDDVTVHIIKKGTDEKKTYKITKAAKWELIVNDLDKADEKGAEIQYEVKEEKVNGYDEAKVTGNMTEGFVITNIKKVVPPSPYYPIFVPIEEPKTGEENKTPETKEDPVKEEEKTPDTPQKDELPDEETPSEDPKGEEDIPDDDIEEDDEEARIGEDGNPKGDHQVEKEKDNTKKEGGSLAVTGGLKNFLIPAGLLLGIFSMLLGLTFALKKRMK